MCVATCADQRGEEKEPHDDDDDDDDDDGAPSLSFRGLKTPSTSNIVYFVRRYSYEYFFLHHPAATPFSYGPVSRGEPATK